MNKGIRFCCQRMQSPALALLSLFPGTDAFKVTSVDTKDAELTPQQLANWNSDSICLIQLAFRRTSTLSSLMRALAHCTEFGVRKDNQTLTHKSENIKYR